MNDDYHVLVKDSSLVTLDRKHLLREGCYEVKVPIKPYLRHSPSRLSTRCIGVNDRFSSVTGVT